MKKIKITTFLLLGILGIGTTVFIYNNKGNQNYPKPTQHTEVLDKEESEGRGNARAEWIEKMHWAAEGVDWRTIEYRNTIERLNKRNLNLSRNEEVDSFANGAVIGKWYERGSNNQAGSVHDTEYDVENDWIYTVADGGTIFRGKRDDSKWQVVNQDYVFSKGLLKFITYNENQRLIALINKVPHYSDDDGATWISSTGISKLDNWGGVHEGTIVDGKIVVISKPDYWTDYELYVSSDGGQTFSSEHTFGHNLQIHLTKVHGKEKVLIAQKLDNGATIYSYDPVTNITTSVATGNNSFFSSARANIVATALPEDGERWYKYNGSNNIAYTDDMGITWTNTGIMPTTPWEVGLFVSPSDPDNIFYGDIECYRSPNKGQTWIKTNGWAEYYTNVEGAIHADMMYFNEFQTADSTNFTLVSNHGGLSYSTNQLLTLSNIGEDGLNVGQFYDVRTSPIDTSYIFAGTQDQGFLSMATANNEDIFDAVQTISGDYGDIIFSNNGTGMWTVYPFGWVTYYRSNTNNLPNLNINASYEVESQNENGWLPAMMPSPNPNENAIYYAGGSATGGAGSYIIKLSVNSSGNIMLANNLPYNFYNIAGGSLLSAIDWAPSNTNRWYAATENGRFFYSSNSGVTWTQAINFLPEAFYLHGQALDVHPLDEDIVVFGGSGYSNPPVYLSTNGGENFSSISEGLPSTLVFDMTFNDDGTLIFAATEAGPYVYDFETAMWYDLYSANTPNTRYWSVEYLAEQRIVRYGTFGRGTWDLKLNWKAPTENPISIENITSATNNIKTYPNPVQDILTIELKQEQVVDIRLFDSAGKMVKQMNVEGQELQMSMGELPKGMYTLLLKTEEKAFSKKILKQ